MRTTGFKVSEEEYNHLKSISLRSGKTLSAYLRETVFSHINKTQIDAKAERIEKLISNINHHTQVNQVVLKEFIRMHFKEPERFDQFWDRVEYQILADLKESFKKNL